MKPFLWLLAVSIAANVAMAGLWLRNHAAASASATSVVAAQSTAQVETTMDIDSPAEAMRAHNAALDQTSAPAAAASWKDIESAELKEWIRRLRGAGCPEETIRDMILAEVNRRYAAKAHDIWPESYADKPFWQVQKSRFNLEEAKQQRQRMRKQRELQKEKSALLVELLGVDPEKQMRIEEGYDEPMDWQEQRIAFLPEAKRAEVLKYLEDWDDRMSEFHTRNQGLYDAQYRAEQKQFEAEKLAGLAQILTPQELREYELRQSQTASQLGNDLRNLAVSREQYEAIFDIRKKYGDSIYNYGNDNNPAEQVAQIEQNKKNMQADIAASLGPDLAKQYDRSQDYYYQQLVRLAKRNEMPSETAGKVYDYKQTAEASAKRLREDKNLTNDQRQELLQRIREEMDATLKQTLGDKAYKSYLGNGGWWLNTIAPAQKK